MKKLIALLLLLCFCMAGCAAPNHPTEAPPVTLPTVPDDYFTLLCTNTDMQITRRSYTRTVRYEFLSAFPLTAEDLQVGFDQFVPFQAAVSIEDSASPLDAAALATFQGTGWQDSAGAAQALAQCKEQLAGLPEEQLPRLYAGVLGITFDDRAMEQEMTLTGLDVTVKGKLYHYDIGTLHLGGDPFQVIYGDGLTATVMALTDVNIPPTHEGVLAADGLELYARKDVQITNIALSTGAVTLDSVSVSRPMPDGTVVDMLWDGVSPIALSAGTTAQFRITAQDARLGDVLVGSRQFCVIFEYTCDGAVYTEYCELHFRMRQHPFHTYLFLTGKPEMAAYYTDYLSIRG